MPLVRDAGIIRNKRGLSHVIAFGKFNIWIVLQRGEHCIGIFLGDFYHADVEMTQRLARHSAASVELGRER